MEQNLTWNSFWADYWAGLCELGNVFLELAARGARYCIKHWRHTLGWVIGIIALGFSRALWSLPAFPDHRPSIVSVGIIAGTMIAGACYLTWGTSKQPKPARTTAVVMAWMVWISMFFPGLIIFAQPFIGKP